MPYVLLIVGFLIGIYCWWEKKKQCDLKKHGIRVLGTIIENSESSPNSKYRLGGNINNPTVKFLTENRVEIIGRPIRVSYHKGKLVFHQMFTFFMTEGIQRSFVQTWANKLRLIRTADKTAAYNIAFVKAWLNSYLFNYKSSINHKAEVELERF